MSAIDTDANTLSGSPSVWFNDGGNGGAVGNGLLNIGNLPTIDFTQELENVEHKSITSTGEMLKDVSLVISKSLGLTITLDEFNEENMNILFGGDGLTTNTQTGDTITDEKHDAPIILDRSLRTVESDISDFYMEASGGLSSYTVAAGDFEVEDASLGMIKILSTGSITSGEVGLEFNYTSAPKVTQTLDPGKDNQLKGSAIIRVDTTGSALHGKAIVWIIQNAILRVESGFTTTPGEFATSQVTLDIIADKVVDATKPYGEMFIG